MNATDFNGSLMEMYTQIVAKIQIPITLTGIMANVLLIVAHIKDPLKRFKTTSSPFILNIAAIDLITSIVILMISVTILTSYDLYKKIEQNAVTRIAGHAFMAISFPSFFSLSIERFCSVVFPLWHRVRITTRVCRYWLCTIWLIHIIFAALNLALLSNHEDQIQSLQFYMGTFFSLTQLIYLGTYVSLKNQRKKVLTEENNSEAAARSIRIRLENEKHFLITIAIVCFVFAFTFVPYFVGMFLFYSLTDNHRASFKRSEIMMSTLYTLGSVLITINFVINPFVYVWRLPKYRKTFKKLYCTKT